MSNELFRGLRRRMTVTYALVFGLACLLIVALTCGLLWLGVMGLEKEALRETADGIAAEQADAHEQSSNGRHGDMHGRMMGRGRNESVRQLLPTADKSLLEIVVTDGKVELLDKQQADEAAPVLQLQANWPRATKEVVVWSGSAASGSPTGDPYAVKPAGRMNATPTIDGDSLHYLVAQVPLTAHSRLYVFKDISGYYGLAASLLPLLAGLLTALWGGAVLLSWWLAGRNLRPVEEMYLKQQQFTSDASHELRTPLSVLRLAVRALSGDTESKLSPFAAKNLRIMDEESTRLERLTEELLLLTRSDSGRLNAEKTTVDLSALANKVLEKMALPAAEKNMFIQAAVDKKITLQGHEDNLQRLMIILLDNAIKYGPEDSDIGFSLTATGGRVLLRVADCGPGISDADKPHVTDRFFRGDKARTHSTGGTGLGLALALAIVQQHGGELRIKDNVPRGTVVEVELPL